MKILTLARQDLTLMLRDRSSLFWVFLAPFVWVGLFGQLSGGGPDGSQTRIGLTVIVEEESALADRFVEILGAENFALTVNRPGVQAAADAPESEGPPSRSLTIPEGFEAAIAAREEVRLELFESDDANMQATFAAEVAVHRAVVRLLADEALGDMDPENDLIKISASWAGVRKIPSGYDQTVPGYLVMFVMMSTLIYGAAGLASERKTGMIARLGTAPLSHGELILGKLAGRVLIAVVQVTIFLIMGFTFFRIDWGSSPAGLVAVLGSLVLCAGSLGLLAGTLFRSPEAAAGIGVVMSLVMSALGGCWWPAEVMPPWLQTAAHVFPTTWAMDGLHQVISWGGGLGDVAVIAAVLTLFALGASSLAVYRLNPAD